MKRFSKKKRKSGESRSNIKKCQTSRSRFIYYDDDHYTKEISRGLKSQLRSKWESDVGIGVMCPQFS